MTANGEAGTEKHKRKTNDPFLKPGGHKNMPNSPRLCTPIKKECPESLPKDKVIGNKDKGFSRYVTSLAGSGHPSTSFCSTTDPKHIDKELPVRNCKNLNSDLVSHPHRQPKVEEQKPLRLSKGLKGIDPPDFWGLKSLSRKDEPQKVFANVSNIDKTITLCKAHLINSTLQNTSSTSNYPQLIREKTVKGKGIVYKDLDKNFGLKGRLMSQEEEKPAFANKFESNTLLRSNVGNNMQSLQEIVISGTESFNNGLDLREWLKSEGHKMEKSERKYIFKQILELVDFAHSKGVVLQDLRPSCFAILPSNKIKYVGTYGQQVLDNKGMTCNLTRKRPWEQDNCACDSLSGKKKKLSEATTSLSRQHHFTCQHSFTEEKRFISITTQLEDKWYCSPEVLNDGICTFSSNIYSLGVLLFEVSKYFGSHIVVLIKLYLVVFPLGRQNILLNFNN